MAPPIVTVWQSCRRRDRRTWEVPVVTKPLPTIWGLHAGRNGEADELFKRGHIALGWDELGDLSLLTVSRDAFKQEVARTYPQDKPGSIPVTAGMLFRFVHEMQEGDLVVSRSKPERVIRIGRVSGPYRYDPGPDATFPHQRAVRWLKTVQPVNVMQGARYEIGSAMTLIQMRNYADEWRHVLFGSKSAQPELRPDEDPTIGPVAADIEELTSDFILGKLAQELKGHPFAAFVAHLLEIMGYRTRVAPEGRDGGIDIVAHRDELGFEPPIIKVQVKSGSGNIGQPEVSALLGTLSQSDFGLFVALGDFTNQARNFARGKANVRLINGTDLVQLVLDHYEQFDSRYKGLLPLKRVYIPEPIEGSEG